MSLRALAPLALGFAACSAAPPTDLAILVDADEALLGELARVEVRVLDGDETRDALEVDLAGGACLPASFGLAASPGRAGVVEIEARFILASGESATQVVETRVGDGRRGLEIALLAADFVPGRRSVESQPDPPLFDDDQRADWAGRACRNAWTPARCADDGGCYGERFCTLDCPAIEPAPPAAPRPVRPAVLPASACPGPRAATPLGERCLPTAPCPVGEVAFPGDAGCAPIDACPPGPFASALPATQGFYVDPAAVEGGDGSLARPYRAVEDALRAIDSLGLGQVFVALAKGTHPADGLRVAKGTALVGACAAGTTLAGARRDLVLTLESGASVEGLRIVGGVSLDGSTGRRLLVEADRGPALQVTGASLLERVSVRGALSTTGRAHVRAFELDVGGSIGVDDRAVLEVERLRAGGARVTGGARLLGSRGDVVGEGLLVSGTGSELQLAEVAIAVRDAATLAEAKVHLATAAVDLETAWRVESAELTIAGGSLDGAGIDAKGSRLSLAGLRVVAARLDVEGGAATIVDGAMADVSASFGSAALELGRLELSGGELTASGLVLRGSDLAIDGGRLTLDCVTGAVDRLALADARMIVSAQAKGCTYTQRLSVRDVSAERSALRLGGQGPDALGPPRTELERLSIATATTTALRLGAGVHGLVDVEIDGPGRATSGAGPAIEVAGGASVELRRAAIGGAASGVSVRDPTTDLTLVDLRVVGEGTCPGGCAGGIGVHAAASASLRLDRFAIEAHPNEGIRLDGSTLAVIGAGRLARNRVGLRAPGDRDPRAFLRGLRYVDNAEANLRLGD